VPPLSNIEASCHGDGFDGVVDNSQIRRNLSAMTLVAVVFPLKSVLGYLNMCIGACEHDPSRPDIRQVEISMRRSQTTKGTN